MAAYVVEKSDDDLFELSPWAPFAPSANLYDIMSHKHVSGSFKSRSIKLLMSERRFTSVFL